MMRISTDQRRSQRGWILNWLTFVIAQRSNATPEFQSSTNSRDASGADTAHGLAGYPFFLREPKQSVTENLTRKINRAFSSTAKADENRQQLSVRKSFSALASHSLAWPLIERQIRDDDPARIVSSIDRQFPLHANRGSLGSRHSASFLRPVEHDLVRIQIFQELGTGADTAHE